MNTPAILFLSALMRAASFEAATASAEITGPPGYPMGGYGARKGTATGTHDPLFAKVLLIRSNEKQFAIVTYDLVLAQSARVAREAREKLGIQTTLQIATHTHSGPVPKDWQKMDQDPWWRSVEDKVLGALKEAQGRYQRASLTVMEGSVYLGHNRRKIGENGLATMFWRNAGRLPTAPVDPRIGILRFTDASGKQLALLVNYACHAVVLGADNLEYSADWPGYMDRELERQLGGMAFFIPGAGGDINPYDDKQPLTQDAFGVARKTGETIAEAVMKALKTRKAVPEDFDLRISQETIDFKDRFKPAGRVPAQATRILFSKDVGVLALPAEPFVRHQINLRDQSPLRHTFLFGYAYGGEGAWAGYIPTIEEAQQGGYGAGYATRIEVGAGERLIDRAVIWFYERLGRLRDVPDRP